MAKLWRLWLGSAKLELSDELSYRFNFTLKTIMNFFTNFFTPIFTLLVYTISSGLPGWSFEEFLLMNGIFILVSGLGGTFFQSMTWRTLDDIWRGRYDQHLIRPVNPLTYATLKTFNPDGLPAVTVGLLIASYALIKLHWIFSVDNLLAFIALVGLALLFLYALCVITIAMAFLFTKSWVLINAFEDILGIGKNPLSIYGSAGTFLFTFVFPVGIAAFYPAQALLGRLSLPMIGELALVAFAFFGFSLLMWNFGIKKYTSAGG